MCVHRSRPRRVFSRRPQGGLANMTGTFGERVAHQSRVAGDELGEAVGKGLGAWGWPSSSPVRPMPGLTHAPTVSGLCVRVGRCGASNLQPAAYRLWVSIDQARVGFLPKAAGWAGEYDWHVRRTGGPTKPAGRGRGRGGCRAGFARLRPLSVLCSGWLMPRPYQAVCAGRCGWGAQPHPPQVQV